MNIWFWDFDQTITIQHTYGTGEDASTLSLEDKAKLRAKIRNAHWLEEFLRRCHAVGDKIFIATFHDNKAHVKAYLNALLGNDDVDKIFNDVICVNDVSSTQRKNGYIEKGKKNLTIKGTNIDSATIILVDDDKSNTDAAIEAGHMAVCAVPNSDEYMSQVEALTDHRLDLINAKKYLDENVFNQNTVYSQKQKMIATVERAFDLLLNDLTKSNLAPEGVMDQISEFFDYINQPLHKEKLNCHKNKKYDSIFFKENTSSWGKMVSKFRNKSLEIVLEFQKVLPEGQQVEFLKKYRGKALFAEHRSNSVFTKLYNTDAVKAIDNAIKERESNKVILVKVS